MSVLILGKFVRRKRRYYYLVSLLPKVLNTAVKPLSGEGPLPSLMLEHSSSLAYELLEDKNHIVLIFVAIVS